MPVSRENKDFSFELGSRINRVVSVLFVYPIFDQNANPFTLGSRVGLYPEYKHYALLIPTCWYEKSLRQPTTRAGGIYFALENLHWHWVRFHVVCVNFVCVR